MHWTRLGVQDRTFGKHTQICLPDHFDGNFSSGFIFIYFMKEALPNEFIRKCVYVYMNE